VSEVINYLSREFEACANIAGRDSPAVGLRNKLEDFNNSGSGLDTRLVSFDVSFFGMNHDGLMPCIVPCVYKN
jgi:hypothetical protein